MAQQFPDVATIQAEAQRIGLPWQKVADDYRAVTKEVNCEFPSLSLQCKAWLVDSHIWSKWLTTPYPHHSICPLPAALESANRHFEELRLKSGHLKNEKEKTEVLMNMKQSVVTQQEDQIKHLQNETRNLNTIIQIAERDLPIQQTRNERLQNERDQKAAQITTLKRRINTLEADISRKDNQITILTAQNTNLNTSEDTQIQTLVARIATLQAAGEQKDGKLSQQTKKIESLDVVIGQKKAKIEVLEDRNSAYKGEIATKGKQIEAFVRQVNALEEEKRRVDAEISDLQGRFSSLNGDIITKTDTINRLEIQVHEVPELDAKVDQMNIQIILLQENINDLESELGKKSTQISSLTTHISYLETEISKKDALREAVSAVSPATPLTTYGKCETMTGGSKPRNNELLNQIETLTKEVESRDASMLVVKQEKLSLSNELEQVYRILKGKANPTDEDLQKEIAELRSTINRERCDNFRKISALRINLEKKNTQINGLNNKIQTLQSTSTRLSMEANGLRVDQTSASSFATTKHGADESESNPDTEGASKRQKMAIELD